MAVRCPVCNREYTLKQNFNRHYRKAHEKSHNGKMKYEEETDPGDSQQTFETSSQGSEDSRGEKQSQQGSDEETESQQGSEESEEETESQQGSDDETESRQGSDEEKQSQQG